MARTRKVRTKKSEPKADVKTTKVKQTEKKSTGLSSSELNNLRCFNQYKKFCEENGMDAEVYENVEPFLKACADGWPNGKVKKRSSLTIKYRGITNYLKSKGYDVSTEKGFVDNIIAE